MFTSSSGTDWVSNEHENESKFGSYAIPPKDIPHGILPASFFFNSTMLIDVNVPSSNNVLYSHEDEGQYGPSGIPCKNIPSLIFACKFCESVPNFDKLIWH